MALRLEELLQIERGTIDDLLEELERVRYSDICRNIASDYKRLPDGLDILTDVRILRQIVEGFSKQPVMTASR
ncbi:MAG: hypothetical protein LH702_04465 [Phormidesmis sp. CAN_BIN44]|nr:hypothetical protein [Phormidesmis sp. CAN_BIN44]